LTSKSRETLKWLLRIVVLTSMGLCIGFDANRVFFTEGLAKISGSYALWDGWLEEAADSGRGIFLKFEDFPDRWAGYTQNIYFRAVYVLYPRRVLVSGHSTTVNKWRELLENNALPSDEWLRDQGVDSVMTIELDPNHHVPLVRDVRRLGE
jgi:hypothetical protein